MPLEEQTATDNGTSLSIRRAALQDKPLIAQLLEDYLRETVGPLAYPYLDAYWSEPERFPYVAVTHQAAVGFALVRRDQNGDWEIVEFYIVPAYRRQALGRMVAQRLVRMHPGSWRVPVQIINSAAVSFWTTVFPDARRELSDSCLVLRFHLSGSR